MLHTTRWTSLAILLAACGGSQQEEYIDADGDGFYINDPDPDRVDCDDSIARGVAVNPAAQEICDGLDNDCNGIVDDEYAEGAQEWWPDDDADGFGRRVEDPIIACNLPRGYSGNRRDCNDKDPQIFPNARERCNLVDDNCNLVIDEGFDPEAIWFLDADRDGFGGAEQVGEGCSRESNWVKDNTDCNDVNSRISPVADEICDGYDNDCDGAVDDDDDDIVGARTWYADTDGDGYGNLLDRLLSCTDPGDTHVANDLDCNDADATQSPETTWYIDADLDGHGNAAAAWPFQQCWQPIGYAITTDDCDDNDPLVWTGQQFLGDADRDGYGGPTPVWEGCGYTPGAHIPVSDDLPIDCDDRDENVNVDAQEICNGGIDDDCDGLADDADPEVIGRTIFYEDRDGDGEGAFFRRVEACEAPPGYVTNDDDCDDDDPTVTSGVVWYLDDDRDGYGDPAQPSAATGCDIVPGHVPNTLDCDDSDFYAHDQALWFPDADGDGIGVGTVPVETGCPADQTGLAPVSGDCNDDDVNDATQQCFGESLASVGLVIHVDNDVSNTQGQVRVRLVCSAEVDDVFNRQLLSFDRGDDIVLPEVELAAPQTCRVRIEGTTSDVSGDGWMEVDITVCGQDLPTLVDDASNPTDSPFFDLERCSGCDDPAAINYDPSVYVSTAPDSCIYPPN